MFKKIACAALALTLLGTTAAEARGWGGHGGGYHHGWHGGRGDWALGLGLGILALGAVAAASDHDHYYRERNAYDRGRYDQERYDDDRDYRGHDDGDRGDHRYHGDDGEY